jgi:flagellin
MVINTNTTASAATRNLANSTSLLSKSLARLSSGSKITTPEDDAAGLAQSIKFEAQMNRNNAVKSNLGNAVSFTQTQVTVLNDRIILYLHAAQLSLESTTRC